MITIRPFQAILILSFVIRTTAGDRQLHFPLDLSGLMGRIIALYDLAMACLDLIQALLMAGHVINTWGVIIGKSVLYGVT